MSEGSYRLGFALILSVTILISGYHRAKARRAAPSVPRRAEGRRLIVLRAAFAVPLFLTLLLYMASPRWVGWARVPLPGAVRSTALVLAAMTIPFTWWVFRSLGASVSETVLTRPGQRLVTRGPYRWIRHPLYSGAVTLLAALSLVAANWLMALLTAAVALALPSLARREEANLVAHFGDDYVEYMSRTGPFVPGIGRTPRPRKAP